MLYEEVARRIKSFIKEEGMLPGAKLPAERELAYMLGVSRSSVREALRLLEREGAVTVQPGEGTFVATADCDLLDELGTLDIDAEAGTMLELQQVRRILEVEAVRLATVKATDLVLEKLERIVEETRQKAAVGESVIEEDLAFHRTIVAAAGNHVLMRLYESVVDLLIEVRKAGLSLHGAANVAKSHAGILQAMRTRNPDRAAEEMIKHLDSVERDIRVKFGLWE